VALALFPGFIGGSYTSWSSYADAQETWNLFVEHVESKPATVSGGSAVPAALVLYGTPGISLLTTLPQSPIRGIWANQTRTFVASGARLYEVFQGIVSTAGTSVGLQSGSGFVAGMVGTTIRINGVNYTVATFVGSTGITLTSSAGTQTSVSYVGYNDRGVIGTDGLPVQIFPNGSQLLIISAGLVYCDNGAGPVQVFYPALAGTATGGVLTPANVPGFGYGLWYKITGTGGDSFDQTFLGQAITLTGATGGSNPNLIVQVIDATHILVAFNPGGSVTAWTATLPVTGSPGAFLDGYFIASAPNTKQFNISAINDGTTWHPIDFAVKEAYPDNIQAILADHEELWLFGSDTTEVWQNTGAASFPLARIAGAFIPHGCCAPNSPARLGESVVWLSNDAARGGVVAYLAQGFQPQRVSTSAIEAIWRSYSTVGDAVSYTYVDQGHEFWVVTFPSGNATWCYDRTAGYWHRRGWWNGSSNDRQRGMFHAWCFGEHIVGDWSTGALYAMDMAFYTDNGTQITRSRAARLPSTKAADWSYLHKFRLIAENSGAIDPSLDYSLDGGETFIGARTTAPPFVAGAFGYYDWRRLGRHRDRVLRITITAALKVALIEASVDVE
jgi:hypothetical protein